MEMTVKMTKAEAEQLLKGALKPKLGDVEFRVKDVTWPSSYSTSPVEFELTTAADSTSEEEG